MNPFSREKKQQITLSVLTVFPLATLLAASMLSFGIAAMDASAQGDSARAERCDWVTPKRLDALAPHPRLFVSQEQIARMVKGRGEAFSEDYEWVEAAAETGVRDTETPMANISRWSRGVLIQGRLTALAIQWHRTRDRRYLEAALETVDAMKAWMKPNQITLAEGQYIAGLAVTYDLLYNDLSPEQRAWMVEIARDHFVKPFLRVTGSADRTQRIEGERRSWWQGILSNWNPVSITGGGLLALTMYEALPEAQTMIDRVNASYQPIFDYLQKSEGGWMEGLGYWNWTIHYMSLFGVSYERTTGKTLPGFHSDGFRQTLTFGTYFVPHGEACGFGDNRHGRFSFSLMAAARHFGYDDALKRLQDHRLRMKAAARLKEERQAEAADKRGQEPQESEKQPESDAPVNISYGGPNRLLIGPDPLEKGIEPQKDAVRQYPVQGWGMLADQWPKPAIFAAVRGGELGGAHTHTDLLSWQAVVGIEQMIDECGDGRISSAAFGARDGDIFERSIAAKNTLFIGSIPPNKTRRGKASAKTQIFPLVSGPALRLEATRAFWVGRGNPQFVARLFAIIDDKGLLVIDRVIGRAGNPVEARAYTRKEAIFGEHDVWLKGAFETARLTFAADHPARLRRASALITPGTGEAPVMMRWQVVGKPKTVTMATLLSRGDGEVALTVESKGDAVIVSMKGEGWEKGIHLTDRLIPIE